MKVAISKKLLLSAEPSQVAKSQMLVQNVSIIKYWLFLSHFGTFAVTQPETKQEASEVCRQRMPFSSQDL